MGLGSSKPTTKYDWKPDLQDYREGFFRYNRVKKELGFYFDLRSYFQPLEKSYGSSAANAISTILNGYGVKYVYRDEIGTGIKQCLDSVRIQGWQEKVDLEKPVSEMSLEELKDMNKRMRDPVPSLEMQKLYNFRNQLKMSLKDGFPVLFGFSVYESFEEALKTGKLERPAPDEEILGGLCGIIIGWDDGDEAWIVLVPQIAQGDGGKLEDAIVKVPYDYMSARSEMTGDFWRIRILKK